jgi:hypothetical protein
MGIVNPSDRISQYFTWHEAIWLPQWNRHANDEELTDEVKSNLVTTFGKMDSVRVFFGAAARVHCALRPPAYNALPSIKGAPHSGHVTGQACDFDIVGIACDIARQRLLDAGFLEDNQIRMEKRPGSNWVHIDWKQVVPGGHRYFDV